MGMFFICVDEVSTSIMLDMFVILLLPILSVSHHGAILWNIWILDAQVHTLPRTLFGRLIDNFGDSVAALLSIQYRSNEIIMGWSSKSFYDSKLLAASSVACQTLKLQEAPGDNITSEILEILMAPMLFVAWI